MKLLLKPTALLVLLGYTAQSVSAAEPVCITQAEARAAIVKLAPAALQGVRDKCRSWLPRTAYLNQQAMVLSARLASPKLSDPTSLQSLIGKLKPAGLPNLVNGALLEIVTASIVSGLEKDLKVTSCPTIDQSLALLDPLPTENLIGVIQIIATQAALDDASKRKAAGKSVGIQLCEPNL